ncbi:unnamed protein product, partial [Amoebophrya sp. A25]|eukprot:GSA25T00009990001.1
MLAVISSFSLGWKRHIHRCTLHEARSFSGAAGVGAFRRKTSVAPGVSADEAWAATKDIHGQKPKDAFSACTTAQHESTKNKKVVDIMSVPGGALPKLLNMEVVNNAPDCGRGAEQEGDSHVRHMVQELRVGFVGLGKIGAAMARNMNKAGVKSLCGYDPGLPAESDLHSKIAVFDQPGEALSRVFSESEVIISALPNDAAVEKAFLKSPDHGKEGSLISQLPRNSVHISVSTISPALAARLAAAHAEFGSFFISAPVFARPDGLAKREAFFPMAGQADLI